MAKAATTVSLSADLVPAPEGVDFVSVNCTHRTATSTDGRAWKLEGDTWKPLTEAKPQ